MKELCVCTNKKTKLMIWSKEPKNVGKQTDGGSDARVYRVEHKFQRGSGGRKFGFERLGKRSDRASS